MDRKQPVAQRGFRPAVNILLIVAVVALVVVPLVIRTGSQFGGTDNAAVSEIGSIDPNAKPWFTPLWTPPGPEVESFLFSLQAALGAGFIGYFFGYKRGRSAGNSTAGQKTDSDAPRETNT